MSAFSYNGLRRAAAAISAAALFPVAAAQTLEETPTNPLARYISADLLSHMGVEINDDNLTLTGPLSTAQGEKRNVFFICGFNHDNWQIVRTIGDPAGYRAVRSINGEAYFETFAPETLAPDAREIRLHRTVLTAQGEIFGLNCNDRTQQCHSVHAMMTREKLSRTRTLIGNVCRTLHATIPVAP